MPYLAIIASNAQVICLSVHYFEQRGDINNFKYFLKIKTIKSGLYGSKGGGCALHLPLRPKMFSISCVFWKIWLNHRLALLGYHIDTPSLAKSDAKVKAIWPSH